MGLSAFIMNKTYKIITDSSCDFTQELADKLELTVLPLSVTVDGKTYHNYLDGREIGFKEYYQKLRDGASAQTSAANIDSFVNVMEEILSAGHDVLYLGFSSALSSTYNSGFSAAAELREKYPERKIITVDTLAASLGFGLLVYLTANKRLDGASIEEAAEFAESTKLHICHWFTVDDLHHLRRGGRVSATAAILGTALKIKPVMHVDNDGRLILITKARGRRASIKMLAKRMEETAIEPENQTIFISHGDCQEDAEFLADMIKNELHVKNVIINYVGPVIGAHSGPGTLALFFVGTER